MDPVFFMYVFHGKFCQVDDIAESIRITLKSTKSSKTTKSSI